VIQRRDWQFYQSTRQLLLSSVFRAATLRCLCVENVLRRTGYPFWVASRTAFSLSERFRRRWLSHHAFQGEGIADCVSCLIVIKVDVHGVELSRPDFNLTSPVLQAVVAVASLVLTRGRTVQAHVGEVGSQVQG